MDLQLKGKRVLVTGGSRGIGKAIAKGLALEGVDVAQVSTAFASATVQLGGLAARQSGNAVGSIRNVAVAALTKNLAYELGPAGINVTVVHPRLTRTERTAPLVPARAQA